MQLLDNGGRLVESVAELPDLRNAKKLFADFETTSGNDKLDALNPWHNCKVAGIGITIDDAQGAWYVPIGHRDSDANLPREPVEKWWQAVASTANAWVNQNVKYDAHVSALDLGYLPEWPRQKLVCTLTRAKIHDSDRGFGRGGYTLDALTRDWLGYEIGGYESEIKKWLGDSKDYGVIPTEVMAPYGCQDVISVRHLDAYLEAQLHQECWGVAHMEVDLTSVLLGMERRGMRVDMTELKVAELLHGMRLMEIDDELRKLTGRCLNPSSSDQVYDLLCCQYGLPVLRWTEEDDDGNPAGNPSFDKFALEMYASHPLRPRGPNGEEIIGLVQEARTLTQLLGLFVRPYQKLAVKGSDGCWYLHPSTNQLVRTGRMSMSDPNMQQLSKLAKKLIHPSTRGAYLSLDQSQVEFRVIVHYIQNQRCIDAYLKDPDTDFHKYIAEGACMARKPAKTMNFLMGFGGGKKLAIKRLSINSDVIGAMEKDVDDRIRRDLIDPANRITAIEQACKAKGESVYDDYHRFLPELKPTSRRAAAVCHERGYVRNWHGRHRRLPPEISHLAFNTLCQGEAADIQKERTVAAARACLGTEIGLVGNVHDEAVFDGPAEQMADPRTQAAMCWMMETIDNPLRVPLRASVGYSDKSWWEASTDVKDGGTSGPLHYDASLINKEDPLCHLR